MCFRNYTVGGKVDVVMSNRHDGGRGDESDSGNEVMRVTLATIVCVTECKL